MPSILISGGFDPVHGGHLRMMAEAAAHGRVIVALNSDEWLLRKKGYVFMEWAHRREILLHTRYVDSVVPVDDSDDTVIKALQDIQPNCFGNGGDRGQKNTPELETCGHLGIMPIFGLGGGDKYASSSELVAAACREICSKWK